jgi:hypothetical protein
MRTSIQKLNILSIEIQNDQNLGAKGEGES